MTVNRGKQFEQKLRECWAETMPDSWLFRLKDQMSGYKISSTNPCDFIGFKSPRLFLIECKEHKGNTWSLDFRQYDDLLSYKNITNIFPGVLLWFQDHDKVIWVPIEEIEKMKKDGKKSVNIKMLDEKVYNIIEIPSKKLRILMDSDYSIFNTFDYK